MVSTLCMGGYRDSRKFMETASYLILPCTAVHLLMWFPGEGSEYMRSVPNCDYLSIPTSVFSSQTVHRQPANYPVPHTIPKSFWWSLIQHRSASEHPVISAFVLCLCWLLPTVSSVPSSFQVSVKIQHSLGNPCRLLQSTLPTCCP